MSGGEGMVMTRAALRRLAETAGIDTSSLADHEVLARLDEYLAKQRAALRRSEPAGAAPERVELGERA